MSILRITLCIKEKVNINSFKRKLSKDKPMFGKSRLRECEFQKKKKQEHKLIKEKSMA